MKKIVNKIKETLGYKVVVGVMTFVIANFMTENNENNIVNPIVQEKENYTTEIAFEKKFLEVKNIYLDQDLTY